MNGAENKMWSVHPQCTAVSLTVTVNAAILKVALLGQMFCG